MNELIQRLRQLQQLDLIRPRPGSPELEYNFKHAFTQETIYNSLLHAERRQLHQQVGEALEAIYARAAGSGPDGERHGLEEIVPMLAYHFEKGSDRARALKYLKMAAAHARRAYANKEAENYYSRALALLDAGERRQRWELLAEREQVLDRLGERQQQATALVLMQTLAELVGDDLFLALTHNRRAAYFDRISEYQAAAEAARAGLLAARRSGHGQVEAQSLNLMALAAWRRFDYAEVKKYAGQALDLLKTIGDPATKITSLLHLGRASYRLGQYDTALEFVQAAAAIARQTDNRDSDALAHLILGWIYQRLGQYDAARQHFQNSLDTRRLIGDRYGEATALSHLGWLAYDERDCQPGLDYCRSALEISQAIGDRENEAYALSGMALNYEQHPQPDAERAAALYRQALAIHRDIGATTLAIFDHAGLARLALSQQDHGLARRHIDHVVNWIMNGNAQRFWDPWIIYLSAYQVLTALAETETAQAILAEAHGLLQQRAQEISDETLRRRFLDEVATNRAIQQAWQQTQGPER